TSSTEVDGVSTSGVDFWHAVEFSRNGRFLCTRPRGLSSGLSFFVLAFPTLSESVPLAFQVIRFRVSPFRRFRLYQRFSFALTTRRFAE
ncbi:hypothetical protein ACGFX2_16925, partial [Streptomyces goshikiensis]|uniref:hypothetical protein n=1 Tax=Streptomyces goshikiensis TaxID=1942 RepID=UPI003723ABBC